MLLLSKIIRKIEKYILLYVKLNRLVSYFFLLCFNNCVRNLNPKFKLFTIYEVSTSPYYGTQVTRVNNKSPTKLRENDIFSTTCNVAGKTKTDRKRIFKSLFFQVSLCYFFYYTIYNRNRVKMLQVLVFPGTLTVVIHKIILINRLFYVVMQAHSTDASGHLTV